MKTTIKIFTVLVITLTALGVSAPTVLAAPPANDTFPNATLVTIGYSEISDTTEATTDSDDTQLNATCGAPATDASVWYALQGTGAGVVVDVSQSNYSAGVLVGAGTEGNLTTVACGPGAVGFFAEAGITYYILAIDDQLNGDGLNGGSLNISFAEIPPPPTVDITVNRYGTFNSKTGTATISGTYTCSGGDFIQVDVEAHQNVGRFTILGFGSFFDFSTCDGTSHSWAAEVLPQNGAFKGGKTLTLNFAYACGPFECGFDYVEQKVQLRGK